MTEEIVRLHLSKINVNKSCGPDEVHPLMVLELADIIAEPISFLFNLIFVQESCRRIRSLHSNHQFLKRC